MGNYLVPSGRGGYMVRRNDNSVIMTESELIRKIDNRINEAIWDIFKKDKNRPKDIDGYDEWIEYLKKYMQHTIEDIDKMINHTCQYYPTDERKGRIVRDGLCFGTENVKNIFMDTIKIIKFRLSSMMDEVENLYFSKRENIIRYLQNKYEEIRDLQALIIKTEKKLYTNEFGDFDEYEEVKNGVFELKSIERKKYDYLVDLNDHLNDLIDILNGKDDE